MALHAKGWKKIRWREGSKGWLESRFVAVRVQASHGFVDGEPPHKEVWLLVQWPEEEKEPVVGLRSGLRRAQKWGSGDCFLLSSRIVHPFGQRGAISLAGDLENDRPFDQPIEESHRQRAIGHVVSPFVEVDVGHQGGGALLVA